jgi:hypothetical protein
MVADGFSLMRVDGAGDRQIGNVFGFAEALGKGRSSKSLKNIAR